MNWLETIFHYAPDGGSGLAEALLVLVIACLVARTWKRRRGPQRVNR
jgi:hypothetical protein